MQLVVDTDTGIDDALALLWLAARDDVELVEVHTTHGNTSTEQAAANARTVLDVTGLTNVPVGIDNLKSVFLGFPPVYGCALNFDFNRSRAPLIITYIVETAGSGKSRAAALLP